MILVLGDWGWVGLALMLFFAFLIGASAGAILVDWLGRRR